MSTWDRRVSLSIPDVLFRNQTVVVAESLVLLIAAWSLAAHGFDLVDTISSPTLVAAEFFDIMTGDEWALHLGATLRRVLLGFVLTLVVGTAIGVATGMSDFWEKMFQDYVTVGLALPSLFAAVFTAMWFGRSDITPMVASALIAFPFLAQEVYEGVRNIDNDILEMASAFGVSRNRAIKRIIIQSILPQWFGGVRYSFALAWKITTLAEFVATSTGIGFKIAFSMHHLAVDGVIAWTLLFIVVMLVLEYGVLAQIEARVFDWREDVSIGWGTT